MTSTYQTETEGALRARIDHFYARQMHALDEGRAEEWAATFTEDGVFAADGRPQPTRGRAELAAAATETWRALADQGVVHRHWLGMIAVDPAPDGVVRVRCYALVIATPRGGTPAIRFSTACEDVLVPSGDDWLVRERHVTRDDLG